MDEYKLLHDFGRNLKALLTDAQMSQKELSKLTGISECNISKYIAGNMMPSLKSIMNIMEALDCDFEDLVD